MFEVDFPATQEWKKEMLEKAGIGVPADVTFVAVDFERDGKRVVAHAASAIHASGAGGKYRDLHP